MKLEKIHYQSDWAEAGLISPLNSYTSCASERNCVREKNASGAEFRWIVKENGFESGFYGFPVLELRLEVDDPDGVFLTSRMDNADLNRELYLETSDIMRNPSWGKAYLYSRLIRNEPFFGALDRLDFIEVELRRLYRCRFGDLQRTRDNGDIGSGVKFCTLSDFSPEKIPGLNEQILGLCREAFHSGHTRHFNDPLLSGIRSGTEYILAVMELNFRKVDPGHFLVAVEEESRGICGFSVFGEKTGVEGGVYTQLLSAVSGPYRGKGIYRGLTELASRIFPPDAGLLNVTHVRNRKIQRAYQGSGRRHVADTVVLRRFFSS